MRRRLAIFSALVRVALMTTIQYRSNFLLGFFSGISSTLGVTIPIWFVYDQTPVVAGWERPDALLVTAFFLLLSSVVGMFVEPNLGAIVEGVRSGTLDYVLLKPVDAQLLATLQRINPTRFWEAIGAIGVFSYVFLDQPIPSPAALGLAGLLFVGGLSAMYSLWMLVVCLSFWFVRVDNLSFLLSAISDAGRWPVAVYQGFARIFLTVIIPVALVTSYPAMALRGSVTPAEVAQVLGVGLGGLLISRAVWTRALRHYSSASS